MSKQNHEIHIYQRRNGYWCARYTDHNGNRAYTGGLSHSRAEVLRELAHVFDTEDRT